MDERIYSEKLREIARKRVAAKEFTGAALARHCDISKAHLSNILSGKRDFTLQVFFRFLSFLALTPGDLEERPSKPKALEIALVPIVGQINAITSAIITSDMELEQRSFALPSSRQEPEGIDGSRWSWTRFVAVRPTRRQIKFLDLDPSLNPRIVIDRHDLRVDLLANSGGTLHAISSGNLMSIGYLRESHGQTFLLPRSSAFQPQFITLAPRRNPTHQLVGKIHGIWFSPRKNKPDKLL